MFDTGKVGHAGVGLGMCTLPENARLMGLSLKLCFSITLLDTNLPPVHFFCLWPNDLFFFPVPCPII